MWHSQQFLSHKKVFNLIKPAMDWMFLCPPSSPYRPHPNFMLKPNPQCGSIGSEVFGKWLGNDGGVLLNGINALIKGTLWRSLNSFILWKYSMKAPIYMNGDVGSPDTKFASASILDLSASRIVRYKNFCCL